MEQQKAKEGTQWVLTFHRQAEQEDYRADPEGTQRGGRENKECRVWKAEGVGENISLYSIICGLEATATEAAHGRRLTDEGNRAGMRVGLRSRLEGQLLSLLGHVSWTVALSPSLQFSGYIRDTNSRDLRVMLRQSWKDSAPEPPAPRTAYLCTQHQLLYSLSPPVQLVLLQLQLINCFSNYWVPDSSCQTLGWLRNKWMTMIWSLLSQCSQKGWMLEMEVTTLLKPLIRDHHYFFVGIWLVSPNNCVLT